MQAYAILSGGGIKGAALAGCLQAAAENDITFEGYAGVSAGSIVAFLACIGYEPDALRKKMVVDIELKKLLDDGGYRLRSLLDLLEHVQKADWRAIAATLISPFDPRYRDVLQFLVRDQGLYTGDKFKQQLWQMSRENLRGLSDYRDVTFANLERVGFPHLKIICTDVRTHQPCVFPFDGRADDTTNVIDAVRASMSYPLVFRPVLLNKKWLVDGGMTSNVPIFAFQEERKDKPFPVIAFELVNHQPAKSTSYPTAEYVQDLARTALEASEHVIRGIVHGVHYVPIEVPRDIDTLDFFLPPIQLEELYDRGYQQAKDHFNKQKRERQNLLRFRKQMHHAVKPLLEGFANEVTKSFPAVTHVRACVMLPNGRNNRVVTYGYKMERCPDESLEIAADAGCSGQAWATGRPHIENLETTKGKYSDVNLRSLTKAQHDLFFSVRPERRSMASFPIFYGGASDSSDVRGLGDQGLIGTLSIDTDAPLEATKWQIEYEEFIAIGQRWASLIGFVLA